MITKPETHTLLCWFELWSQPARCRVFGRHCFEQIKSVWDREREWLIETLERLRARTTCHIDKQTLTKSQMFESGFFFRTIGASISSACVFGTDSLAPYAPSTYSILSCLCTPVEAALLSKRRYAKQLVPSFLFGFPFVWSQSDPCLAPGVHFLDPALLQPAPSYLHPCRPQWMIHLERLPSSIRKRCNYTPQPSLYFSDLTMLCNAWNTLAFSYVFLFFFLYIHAPSLALSLSCIQYWLFMLFNVVERARGLRTGEKRSSWHTYAPVVNSSSQHSSKYTDLLLFPLPPFSLSLSFPVSSYNWELLWTSAPHVALLQRSPYGRLRCSNAQAKIFTQ